MASATAAIATAAVGRVAAPSLQEVEQRLRLEVGALAANVLVKGPHAADRLAKHHHKVRTGPVRPRTDGRHRLVRREELRVADGAVARLEQRLVAHGAPDVPPAHPQRCERLRTAFIDIIT